MGTSAFFESNKVERFLGSLHLPRAAKAATSTPARVARRAAGRQVPVDLAIALTSQEMFVETRSKQQSPGGAIAVSPSGTTMALGAQAREMDGRVPPHIRVLQPLQGGRVSDTQLAVRILENALRSAGYSGPLGPRILLEAPDCLTESERRSLHEAARSAGARKVQLVAQSIAAAVGAGLPVLEAHGSLIVDLDSSSAEAGLISYGRLLQSRPLAASRMQFQQAVIDSIRRDSNVQISASSAETLLRELGSVRGQAGKVCTVGGRDLAAGLPRKIDITSEEVENALRPLLEGLVVDLKSMIGETPCQLLGDLVKDGVVLSGANATLDGLESYLSEHIGLPIRTTEAPEQAGARGLRTLLQQEGLRRSLLGTPKAAPRMKSTLSPGRSAAVGLLLVGLLGAGLPMLTGSPAQASGVDNAIDSTLTPLYKLASVSLGGAASQDVLAPASAEERRRESQLSAENARLRSLVKLKSAPFSKGGMMAAHVIAHEPQGWLSSLVLDAGTSSGAKEGMPVVSADGLIGAVSSVNPKSSQVRVLTNPTSAVAATLPRRKAAGVLYGKNQKLCELRFLDPEAHIKVGDQVVTSGLDGKFPAGIKLGRVIQVKPPQDTVYASALVAPSASYNSPEVVLLKQ